MRKLIFLLGMFSIQAGLAQGLKVPAPSPSLSIKQEFALSQVELSYARPAAKGRKIFGDLVPFGKLWRTGANNPTKITFGEDVKIKGQLLKAGAYQLLSIPGQNTWEIKFNKGTNGVFAYKAEEDALSIQVPSVSLNQLQENFSLTFENIQANKMDLVLAWEKTAVYIPIEVDIDAKIMGNIDRAMAADTRPYFEAASYYVETGRNLNQALTWVNKATELNPNAYWQFYLKARIQAKLGDKAGAKTTAQKSMELAKKANNEDYVALNQKLIDSL